MKIVVLDGHTLNPGDLTWDSLTALGDVTIYDKTPAKLICERAKDCEIIFTNKTPLTATEFEMLPSLKYIGVLATGYNVVDTVAAKNFGITVTNIPTYGTNTVAQFVFALILEYCHNVRRHSDAVSAGRWESCEHFCFWDYPLVELSEKTLGIVGFGRIGQKVAEIGNAFGMNIIAYDNYHCDTTHLKNFKWAELDEVFAKSDFVSLHCPLTPQTQGMVDFELLKTMKSNALIVNTSRGPIINEKDLAYALNQDLIAGAAVDVVSIEPIKSDNPLLTAKNCIITPHIAWATKEARARLMDIAVDNLKSFLAGNSTNVINK